MESLLDIGYDAPLEHETNNMLSYVNDSCFGGICVQENSA